MKCFEYVMVLLLMTIVVSAQNSELKKLQDKFESIKSLTADFTQTTKFGDSKNPMTSKGKLFYKSEDKYRIEFGGSELISNGESIWNYNKKANKVIISNPDDEQSSFSIRNFIFEYPKNARVENTGKESLSGKDYNSIKLTSAGDESFKIAKILYDENNLIKKIDIMDNSGSSFSFVLSNVKTDQNIADSRFTFESPKGTEVIDLR